MDTLLAWNSSSKNLFVPLDWQVAPYADTSPILLLTGSAGGGKSRLAGEMIHRDMLRYSGAQGVILRKTRESMNNSTVLSFDLQILQQDKRVHHNRGQHRFEYDNGSMIAYGGMKDDEQREQIRSIGLAGGVDRVWLEEANRFEEADFNELLARMRGIATPYTQIILTTNPDAPSHWIKERLIDQGQASCYFSGAADNTYLPEQYTASLQQMTGIQAMRLREGKWILAEGAIYPNWDMDNVSAEAEYNADLPMFWGVDDGYVFGEGPGRSSYHPRVILFMQPLPNGGVHVVDEYYATGELSETSILNALAKPYKKPEGAYVDSSAAELKGRIWQTGIMTVGATHPVHEGIKVMRDLILDANGVRLFRIHPRCANLNREMASYRYDDASRVANVGEPKPMKVDDHGADAARYFCFHLRYGR
jgi:phage terminase large subunit